jgi:hypothetical protein
MPLGHIHSKDTDGRIHQRNKEPTGEIIDPDTWSIEDHFRMLGVDKMVKDVSI